MKKNCIALLLALVVAVSFAACGSTNPPGAPASGEESGRQAGEETGSGKIKVVTTIFPPYDFVREIAGDRVELAMLLSPGTETHSFEPTPQDMIMLQEADAIIYIGGETDVWLERILGSLDTGEIRLVEMMGYVDVVEEEFVEGMEEDHDHDDGEEHADEHEAEFDEHVWTSPANAMLLVQAIADVLAELDGENAAFFQQNAGAYIAELEELDAAFRDVVDNAVRHTLVFADRFPFRYFADAYGLDYFAAFPGCSTETEASVATVAFLIDKVREEEIPVVLQLELSNGKMAATISESTGAAPRTMHSVHNVTRDEFQAGEGYLSLMWANVEVLKEALWQ